MNDVNFYKAEATSEPYPCRQVVTDSNNNIITILFHLVNEIEHGPAEANYPTFRIKFNYINGNMQGNAMMFFPDGTQIRFTYVDNRPLGRATIIYSDGKEEPFDGSTIRM